MRAAGRAAVESGGGGAIVNMSSSAGRHGYAFRTPYAAAKWGVIGFTQSLAKEVGPATSRSMRSCPASSRGPRMEGVIRARAAQLCVSYADMEKEYLSRVSLRRMVSQQDVARWCCSCCRRSGQYLRPVDRRLRQCRDLVRPFNNPLTDQHKAALN